MDRIDWIIREELNREIRRDRLDEGRKEWAAALALGALGGYGLYHAGDGMYRQSVEEPKEIVVDNRYDDEKMDDIDKSYVMRFIRHSENPDSVGYDRVNDRWYAPTSGKHDSYQYGMGTDIRYNGANKLLKKDKDGKKYMTAADERALRKKNVETAIKSFNQRLAYARKVTGEMDFRPSEEKRAMTISAIYCKGGGRVANEIFTPENCEIFIYGSDEEWRNVIAKFYRSHKVSSRIDREKDFLAMN